MATLDIQIKENIRQIERKMLEGIRDTLNIAFPKTQNDIISNTKRILYGAITSQPEYRSIVSGDLRIELGLVDGGVRLLNIVDRWLASLEVTFTKFRIVGGGFAGGIKIRAIRSDYSDVLSMSDANLITEKDEELPWLRWMLLDGGSLIIADYNVKFQSNRGRTGGGFMIEGRGWSIPEPFSGSSGDNFVTRAVDSIQDRLTDTIIRILESKI
jgi:hypothetical protein